MDTLIVDLCKEPVNPIVTREVNRVVFTRLLLELNGDRHQLAAAIDIEQTEWSRSIGALFGGQPVHNAQVTQVHMASLRMFMNT